MSVLDELPAELRECLDRVDQTAFGVFAQLDEVHRRRHVNGRSTSISALVNELAAEWGDAQWRAAGLWAQLRMRTLWNRNWPDLLWVAAAVPTAVAGRKLRWTPAEMDLLWRTAATPPDGPPGEDLLRIPVSALKRLPLTERKPYLDWVRQARAGLEEDPWSAHSREKRVLDDLLAESTVDDPEAAARSLLPGYDRFAVLLCEEYAPRLGAPAVLPLLRHCAAAASANPSDTWLRRAAALLTPEAVALAGEVLGRLPAHREYTIRHRRDGHEWTQIVYLHERTAQLLRGMVWACELIGEPRVTGLLGEVAVATGTGLGGSGANSRSEMLANAAIGVLARRGGPEVIPQLARVQAKVRKKSILSKVARTLEAVAVQTGLSPERLMDRTVPAFGLDPDGTRTEHGLRLGSDGSVTFVDPAGKVRRTIPKAVREEHAGLLAELKATAKELRKTLPAERFRVERALAAERIWRWSEVCEYYLDHPVTGSFGRSLIWEILQGPAGLPVRVEGRWELTDPAGRRIQPCPDTPVLLWHPISHTADEVRAWRDHLVGTGLRQPFKQAFREVYLLTPAEERTRDHSRRFAGHLLRYGQAKALLTERGWTGMSLGHWGREYGSGQAEAVKELPGGLTASWDFHLDEGSYERDGYGATASVCVSGSIRFTDEHGDIVPLAEVDPLILSEALRDADLAVGVTSTGLDPHGQGDYWTSYGFGDLSESAQVRRDALTRLLPRLAIAERCTLTDRFLHVRGDLRTYKIHLGSGNILMEPNDAYLCIVPGLGASDRLFLPFEEDGGLLSVVISKAFLLAADTEITDPSITHQIRG
ncbi:DUF4132 domain-containing protein [Planobispora siamensis]|uniref:DUF4132 domain-containing protein n=1 Tax=Planobispora siamensis TaxID=936338 RepID=A0A8J3SQA4_9ACTN|nr:DUF4132 domain-containing protein [Planobispora siamensis]GIH96942.1 hypothetical protein Psi01_75720 [Planobispora siamensis]